MKGWNKYLIIGAFWGAIDGGCFGYLLNHAGCSIILTNILAILKGACIGFFIAAVGIARAENKRQSEALEKALDAGEEEHRALHKRMNNISNREIGDIQALLRGAHNRKYYDFELQQIVDKDLIASYTNIKVDNETK